MAYTTINVPVQKAGYPPSDASSAMVKAEEPKVAQTYFVDEPKPSAAPKGRLGAVATIAAGGALALVGVPLLVLPGPGLLTIGGGITLMTKGLKGLGAKPAGKP